VIDSPFVSYADRPSQQSGDHPVVVLRNRVVQVDEVNMLLSQESGPPHAGANELNGITELLNDSKRSEKRSISTTELLEHSNPKRMRSIKDVDG
jgi:hypothetical protein